MRLSPNLESGHQDTLSRLATNGLQPDSTC